MEGSSESGWQKSDSSRGFNGSSVSDRNPRLFRGNRIRSSGDASQDSGSIPVRKERDRVVLAHRDLHRNPVGLSGVCEDELGRSPVVRAIEWNDVSLRQWLDDPERSVDATECLHIFTQIVEIVNLAHSQGVVVNNVRPSCFVMSSFNHVSFIESASCSLESGSDSMEDMSNGQTAECKRSSSPLAHDSHRHRSHFGTERLEMNQTNASHLASESSCLQSSSVYPMHKSLEVGSDVKQAEEKKHSFPMKQILLMESNWYTSPEEVAGAPSSCASDVYRLGVLLFEVSNLLLKFFKMSCAFLFSIGLFVDYFWKYIQLVVLFFHFPLLLAGVTVFISEQLFCTFSSAEEKSSTMSSLRHRVLPPQLLLKWPKEASFCLWLLHPDSCSRPKMRYLPITYPMYVSCVIFKFPVRVISCF